MQGFDNTDHGLIQPNQFGFQIANDIWAKHNVLNQKPRFVQVHITGENSDGSWQTDFTGATLLINDPQFRKNYRLIETTSLPSIFERISQP